jgi:hypothetical protein
MDAGRGEGVLTARGSRIPPLPVATAWIRLAAAHRAGIRGTQPELWENLERFYRQHLRPQLASADARHWDAALRIVD